MIAIDKLCSNSDKDIIKVLYFIKSTRKISIGSIQRVCNMGYGRVARYIELMTEIGLLKNPHKYHMVVGKDGKRHRQYLPYELIASDEELGYCITELERIM